MTDHLVVPAAVTWAVVTTLAATVVGAVHRLASARGEAGSAAGLETVLASAVAVMLVGGR